TPKTPGCFHNSCGSKCSRDNQDFNNQDFNNQDFNNQDFNNQGLDSPGF
ncbi:MAG: hypothetical protein ACI814_004724, partial [Mariniblastus sp.]